METRDQEVTGVPAPQYNPAAQSADGVSGGQAADAPAKRANTWLLPVVVLLGLLIVLAFAVSSCTSSFMNRVDSLVHPVSSKVTTSESVAVISLVGEISYDGSACSPEGFKSLLDQAEADPLVKAVVLRVNSGGGTATAGEEMTVYLEKFSKPVVVSCAATNASAAYMISSQADYIYSARSSAVGAIGVAMQLVDYSGLMNLLGISTENIVSSENKDSTYGTRSLTDKEREEYQHQVDQINDVFVEFVSKGRNMSQAQVRALATGMTYTGMDAVSNGLVDEIGTLEDACAKAASLAGISRYDVVCFDQESFNLSSLLGTSVSDSVTLKDLASSYKELK